MVKNQRLKTLHMINHNYNITKSAQSIIDTLPKNVDGQTIAEEIFKKLWDNLSIEELESATKI